MKPERSKAAKGRHAVGRGESTRERIISVATALFESKGYASVSIKQISEAAGVNIAAVNYHFESKEKLYYRIADSFGSAELARALSLLKPAATRDEFGLRLQLFVEAVMDSLFNNLPVFRMLMRNQEHHFDIHGGKVGKNFLKFHEVVAAYIRAGKESGFVSEDIVPGAAAGMLLDIMVARAQMEGIRKRIPDKTICGPKFQQVWLVQVMHIYLKGISAS